MELLNFEEVKISASIKDGFTQAQDAQFRAEGLVLIRDLAMHLHVAQPALASGQVLFHIVRDI